MTSIFLHGPGSWATIGPSERRAIIDKRGELALRQEGVAPPVFDGRILGATRGRWAVPLCVQLRVMPEDALLVEWDPPLRREIGRDARALGDAVVHGDDSRQFLFQALHRF